MRLLLVSAFCLCSAAAVAETDTLSGNYYLPSCKGFLSDAPVTDVKNAYDQGVCYGAIRTLTFLAVLMPPDFNFCMPPQATMGQAVRVTIAYIEARPERMHEPYIMLALDALHAAWPCK